MPPLGWSFLWLVVVACLALACASIAHWGGGEGEGASPASLPCLSLLPHSGATCFSATTGALDWEETVENAAAGPTVDLEIPLLG